MLELLMKYLIHGLVIVGLAFGLGKGRRDLNNLLMMAVGSAVSFLLLDMFSPTVGVSARKGAGLAMGMEMVGGGKDKDGKICESYREFEKLKQSIEKLEQIYNSDEMAGVIEKCPVKDKDGEEEKEQDEQQQQEEEEDDEQDVEDLIDDMEDQQGGGYMPQAGGCDLGVRYADF